VLVYASFIESWKLKDRACEGCLQAWECYE
jgi:hypothetical protein